MKTADRVEGLLTGFSAEDRVRLRSVQWAAEFLGLSVPTIYRRVARESIPYVKLGGRVLFRLADIVAWSQEREVAAPVSAARARISKAEEVGA